jgi:heterodisulfide reductase subunit A
MVKAVIDGKEVEVEPGKTILQLAREMQIDIPTLCHHDALEPVGACRLCTVEVEIRGRTRLVTSCNYPIKEDIEIRTASERVQRHRKMIVELLLARCPKVPVIQKLAEKYGVGKPRFVTENEDEDCILCGLCTRICNERIGAGAISLVGRGTDLKVDTPYHIDSDVCIACGACAFVCPTGAIKLEDIVGHSGEPLLSEFNENLNQRANIHLPYPQATPRVPVIDRDNCVHYQLGTCRICEEFCAAGAIKFDQEDEEIEIEAGSVIIAPGYELFDAQLRGEYGYGRIPNVITSLEFERILSASGPYAGVVQRPSDGSHPERIAWIQCVGSRDSNIGNKYCSAVCCMYATKEAMVAREHDANVKTTIFYMDIRAYGKGFDQFYERAKSEYGVRYVRSMISRVIEDPASGNLELTYMDEKGEFQTEEFDLLVLSCGLSVSPAVRSLGERLGVELDQYGFCVSDEFNPVATSREGVYVCGVFQGPKDIPETVAQASGAAANAASMLAAERGSLVVKQEIPEERDVSGEEPRIGVFVCRCGINIGSVVDVPGVKEYAETLPNVVYADENLFSCSQDTQKKIVEKIKEHNLNRVVVASCSPRTHEPLFQETIQEAGLNKFLFEMANIRDQCSWVHQQEKEDATKKARDLVRMAVANSRLEQPLSQLARPITKSGLVIGGGVAGMNAALGLAKQGYSAVLVEKEDELGGNARNLHYSERGTDIGAYIDGLVAEVNASDMVSVYAGAEIVKFGGYIGNFETTIKTAAGGEELVQHGISIIATGAHEAIPTDYEYGKSDRIMTQLQFEDKLSGKEERVTGAGVVAMIQCVGSRNQERPYCSRVCCTEALKNALKLKELSPEAQVFIFYRDIRSYGMLEEYYDRARRAGVIFIRFVPGTDTEPRVNIERDGIGIDFTESFLNEAMSIKADYLVLSSATEPNPNEKLSAMMKVPQTAEGFFLEAHAKLRPVDFASDGIYLCGMAHSPMRMNEAISQAAAAVSRACTVLSQDTITIGGIISVVDPEKCAACLTCVRVCPYNVPVITDEHTAYIEPAACQGCGICSADCPAGAITLQHYRDVQLIEKTKALFEGASANG